MRAHRDHCRSIHGGQARGVVHNLGQNVVTARTTLDRSEPNLTWVPRAAYLAVGALVWVYLFVVLAPVMGTFGADAIAYAMATPPLYDAPGGTFGAFTYSPAFYQAVAPLQSLGWPGFATVWTALLVGTAVWLGPLALAFPIVPLEVYLGNVHLLIAAAIVLGFRHPWTWAFILLTKPTCGIGLLWFAARGEWRNLGIALGATVAVVAVSFALGPELWVDYVSRLIGYVGSSPEVGLSLPVPLWVRLPVAAVVVVWGARTDRRWTVPVAVMLALPVLWVHGLAILAAVPILLAARSGGWSWSRPARRIAVGPALPPSGP
jgi:hypothetical protein